MTQIENTNITILRSENLSKRKNFGVSTSTPLKITPWWNSNTFLNLHRNEFSGNQEASSVATGIWSYTVNSQHTQKFSKGFSSEMSFLYNSKSIYGLFERKDFFVVAAGIQKKILSDKGTVKIALNDIFKSRRFYREMKSGNISMYENTSLDRRILNLSFSYNFGSKNDISRKINREDDETKSRVK